jgi:hypothetical protein
MAKPLGLVIDANPNVSAIDIYALVLNNVVMNTIVSSYQAIQSIAPTYDYSVDVTMGRQSNAGVGFTYDASLDQFTAPPAPPVNYLINTQNDFQNIVADILSAVSDTKTGVLTVNQINQAYNSAINNVPPMDPSLNALMETILQFVSSGG